MGDHDNPPTCLSSYPHDNNVRDELLHYFGCLRGQQREPYFITLPEHKRQRIENEKRRIREQRALFRDEEDQRVREHRMFFKDEEGKKKNTLPPRPVHDLNEKIRSYLNAKAKTKIFKRSKRSNETVQEYEKPCKENGFGLSAYAIFFKNSRFYTDDLCTDTFPNQKIPIKDLLYNKDKATNPLMRKCEEDEIRYFHLPGNNMEWVEEAIARHYNEDRPEYEGLFRRPDRPSKTYMSLRPEFWRGQQHGGRHDNVHARHMRHRCDIFSVEPHLEASPKNLVLFMPYLHWETNRRRAKFDEVMRKITERHIAKEAKKYSALKARHKESLVSPIVTRDLDAESAHEEAVNGSGTQDFKIITTVTELVDVKLQREVERHPHSTFSKTPVARQIARGPLAPRNALGQILHQAAQIYEEMNYYQEQKLLETYLHHDPPFHPRRTLNQSYYWTLKTTKKLDRDQVVYKGTTSNSEFRHSGVDCEEGVGCLQCRQDVRKIPRLIMVDQLWLWILDGNTIITSFPKRYGRNKPDVSSVHKRIRMKLRVCRPNEIRSAYDLALIVIDQCSRVLFDSVKTADRQPQVMDLFASAIGNITNRQTIAYQHFWDTTREAAKMYTSQYPIANLAEDKSKSLLDINTEGKLLREVKDILDELHIMVDIKHKQESVLKQFRKHVEAVMRPHEVHDTPHKKHSRSAAHGAESEPDLWGKKKKKGKHAVKTEKDENCDWTLDLATEVSANLHERVADLMNLKESAEHAEKALDVLLSLKQQQASVVQAQKASQQTEETLRQGRSIMLFTTVTIIFLPLGFMASIFGMNSVEFNGGLWTLKKELIYMFPISTGIIAVSFILAFSSFTRNIISFITNFILDYAAIAWIKFVVITRIYSIWLSLKPNNEALKNKRKKKMKKWKEDARMEKQRRADHRELERRRILEAQQKADAATRRPTGESGIELV